MADQSVINRGLAAKELLKSEVFDAVVNELKREAFEAWMATIPESKDVREDMYYFQIALAQVKDRLVAIRDNGRLESIKLAQEEAVRQTQVTTTQETVDE